MVETPVWLLWRQLWDAVNTPTDRLSGQQTSLQHSWVPACQWKSLCWGAQVGRNAVSRLLSESRLQHQLLRICLVNFWLASFYKHKHVNWFSKLLSPPLSLSLITAPNPNLFFPLSFLPSLSLDTFSLSFSLLLVSVFKKKKRFFCREWLIADRKN